MLSEFDIAKALRDYLGAMPNVPQIATEGTAFTPTQGTPYLEEYTLGGDKITPTLSDQSEMIRGVYQININTPKWQGKWSLLTQANSIMAHFYKGKVLTRNNVTIEIMSASRSTIMPRDAWNTVSITVKYVVV